MITKYEFLFRKCGLRCGFFRQELLQSAFQAAAVLCGLTALAGSLRAQEIKNPSFETPEIGTVKGKSFVMAPSVELKDSGWAWGHFTGICLQDAGFAKRQYAHEGTQMGFLQGDVRKSKSLSKDGPLNMCTGYITGLKPGEDYEIQWAEAGRATDVEFGALSVVLRETGDGSPKPVYLQRAEPVTSRGEWEIKKLQFTATKAEMNVVFLHSVPNYKKGDAVGNEITFLDDLRVVPVAKKSK